MLVDPLAALRAVGIEPIQEDHWRTARASRFGFDPDGIIIHHTAGLNDLKIVRDGRPGLKGPLAQFWVSQKAVVHLISQKRCNHAGRGLWSVVRNVRKDIAPTSNAHAAGLYLNDNRAYWGIEMEGGRFPGDFTTEQLETTHLVAYGLVSASGWTMNRVVRHREHTSRKIDPSTPYPFRTLPTQEDDDMAYFVKQGDSNDWVKWWQERMTRMGVDVGDTDGFYGDQTAAGFAEVLKANAPVTEITPNLAERFDLFYTRWVADNRIDKHERQKHGGTP